MHPVGLRDQSFRIAYDCHFLARLTMEDRDGMKAWVEFGLLWGIAALTARCCFRFCPLRGCGPGIIARGAISGRLPEWCCHRLFSCLHRSVAVRNIGPSGHLFSFATILARNCVLGMARRRRHLDAYLHPTQSLRHAAICGHGRIAVCRDAQAGRRSTISRRIRALRRALPETVYLLLGWAAESGTVLVADAVEELALFRRLRC